MKKIIIANWKLNPKSQKEAGKLFTAIKKGAKKTKNTQVAICPPYVYLPLLKGLTLGAQNVFYKESGAFTGQISSLMLKDLGVEYVILGHSEVRKYLKEDNQTINKKIRECLNTGLKPILCIGEGDGQDKSVILEEQIGGALADISEKYLDDIIIAYEPVFAIGTGKNCSIDETIQSLLIIRHVISKLYSEKAAFAVKILYGGSVNAENAVAYITDAGMNGLLVGNASLNAEEFLKILAI